MNPLLSVRGLSLARGSQRVLRNIDLDVAAGTICVLMGASGAGKSTMLRCIAALDAFDDGTISVDGFVIEAGATPRQSALAPLRKRVAMVFQSHALFEHLSATDNVSLAPIHALKWDRSLARERAVALLAELGVAERASALPRQLSGGEAQRVSIARALIGNPALVLMDEPTSALDPARRMQLATSLRALAGERRSLLIATHDEEFARAVADRVVMLENGAVSDS